VTLDDPQDIGCQIVEAHDMNVILSSLDTKNGCQRTGLADVKQQDGHIDLFISTRRYHRFGSDTYSVLYIKISLFFVGVLDFVNHKLQTW